MGLLAGAALGTVCGGGAVLAAPLVLGVVGFTSAGIAAGSIASSLMSTAAVANGGGVAVGSMVALWQSAGVLGLGAAATTATAATGGTVGAIVGAILI